MEMRLFTPSLLCRIAYRLELLRGQKHRPLVVDQRSNSRQDTEFYL
jgi:hypothetical protein